MDHLQSRLDGLSEHQLRNMVLRVAAQDPYFCDVFAMELGEALNAFTGEDVSCSVAKPCHRRTTRPRTLSNTLVHFPPPRAGTPESDQEEYSYHPGRLETEEYEFLTITQEGREYRQVQTVSMWSCCDGDDMSTGCKIIPAYTVVPGHLESRRRRTRTRLSKQSSSRVRRA